MYLMAILLSALALGQVTQGSWTPVVESMERGYSSISYWTYRDDGVEIGGGRISVEHGKPTWPARLEDEAAFDEATIGKLWRLGNNKWSTLDTNLSLRFGAKRVGPGIYYIAVDRPRADEWRLVFVSPESAASNLIDAWASQARASEVPVLFAVPLRHGTGPASAELDITLGLRDDDMSKGWLRIQWGPHQLETDLTVEMVSPTFYRTEEGSR